MAIILLITTEDGQVSELPLLNKVTMGRSSSSDYKILDTKMSGSHCSFEITPKGQILFKDLGSSNGSFLNNSQIMQTLFRVNDIMKIGYTTIKLEERRLSTSERIAIGTSLPSKENEKTLPDLSNFKTKPNDVNSAEEENAEAKAEASPKKKTIVLSQEHKEKKKAVSNWGAENVIDQEESSGNTKFLKLNKFSLEKKKK